MRKYFEVKDLTKVLDRTVVVHGMWTMDIERIVVNQQQYEDLINCTEHDKRLNYSDEQLTMIFMRWDRVPIVFSNHKELQGIFWRQSV